jgi:hypothetical protein
MRHRIAVMLCSLLLLAGASFGATGNCPSPANGGPVPSYASYYTTTDGSFSAITQSYRSNNLVYFTLANTEATFVVGTLVVVKGTVGGNQTFNTAHAFVYGSGPGFVVVNIPGANTLALAPDDGVVFPYTSGSHPVVVDVTVDGQTTGNTSCMGGATHPHVMGTTVNGNTQTLPVPLTYSTFTSTQTLTGLIDIPSSLSVEGDVNCVAMGLVFDALFRLQFEIAYERAASIGVRSNCTYSSNTKLTKCDIGAIAWCTADSTPPDISTPSVREEVQFMNTPIPTPRFWDIFFLAIRSGPGYPWVEVGGPYGGIAVGSYQTDMPLAECSHNP